MKCERCGGSGILDNCFLTNEEHAEENHCEVCQDMENCTVGDTCPDCNGTGEIRKEHYYIDPTGEKPESHEERIREAFEGWDDERDRFEHEFQFEQAHKSISNAHEEIDKALEVAFKAGAKSRNAEVERLELENVRLDESINLQNKTITALKQQIEDMMEDFEEIEDNLYQDCCGGSDHDPIQAIIDKWAKRGEK